MSTSNRRPPKTILLPATAILAVVVGAVLIWRYQAIVHQGNSARDRIANALDHGDTLTARAALAGITNDEVRLHKERAIRTQELEQALSIRDAARAELALGKDANEFLSPALQERAALLLARKAITSGNTDRYESIRKEWLKKSSNPDLWFLAEADRIVRTGRAASARAFLGSRTLEGKNEALRMARLALLNAEEPRKAFELINKGLTADRTNADLLSFRAQLVEAAGRPGEARVDYVSAIISDPKNPLHRDALARFYLRRGSYPLAIETWHQAMVETEFNVYGFKAWFWSRLSGNPLPDGVETAKDDAWRPFIQTALQLPSDRFWTKALYEAANEIPGQSKRSEWEWLQLLDKLITGEDPQRLLERLEGSISTGLSPSARALEPNLVKLLKACTLAKLKKEQLRAFQPELQEVQGHPFRLTVAQWAKGELDAPEAVRFEEWLSRPEALIGCFLSTGWSGIAVALGGGSKFNLPADSPEWLDYGYARALQISEGPETTVAWLESCTKLSPASQLLLGQLLIAQNKTQEGAKFLKLVASSETQYSERASWLLALTALELGKPDTATRWVNNSEGLRTSARGVEILARAALLHGDRDKASEIYRGITTDSVDAMVFLSKEAFAKRDWNTARKLTMDLITLHPDEPSFRKNLLKIDEAEKEEA